MTATVRRVVLGAEPDGTVDVWFDGPSAHVHGVPGYPPELALVDLWYTAATPATPRVSAAFRVVTFPPDTTLPTGDDGKPALFWNETGVLATVGVADPSGGA
jgi:hypothetical protein